MQTASILSRDAETGTRRLARAVVYSVRVSISIFFLFKGSLRLVKRQGDLD